MGRTSTSSWPESKGTMTASSVPRTWHCPFAGRSGTRNMLTSHSGSGLSTWSLRKNTQTPSTCRRSSAIRGDGGSLILLMKSALVRASCSNRDRSSLAMLQNMSATSAIDPESTKSREGQSDAPGETLRGHVRREGCVSLSQWRGEAKGQSGERGGHGLSEARGPRGRLCSVSSRRKTSRRAGSPVCGPSSPAQGCWHAPCNGRAACHTHHEPHPAPCPRSRAARLRRTVRARRHSAENRHAGARRCHRDAHRGTCGQRPLHRRHAR